MVNFFFEETAEQKLDFLTIERNVEKLILNEKKKVGEINYIFCSDPYLLDINKRYLNHDYYTDVISFDYCENDIISGDIFISIDMVVYNSEKYEVSFLKELYRVIVHGVLHFVGYKDKTEEDSAVMRQKENQYLILFD